jgi:hypothetical protein
MRYLNNFENVCLICVECKWGREAKSDVPRTPQLRQVNTKNPTKKRKRARNYGWSKHKSKLNMRYLNNFENVCLICVECKWGREAKSDVPSTYEDLLDEPTDEIKCQAVVEYALKQPDATPFLPVIRALQHNLQEGYYETNAHFKRDLMWIWGAEGEDLQYMSERVMFGVFMNPLDDIEHKGNFI